MHSSPYLCVCGDDRMIYYPGADVLTGVMGFWRFEFWWTGDAWD